MLHLICIGASSLLVTGQSFAEPIDFATATTLSFTSDGPTLHDTPGSASSGGGTPTAPNPSNQNRITLDDTGQSGWYIAPNAGINLLSEFNDDQIQISYKDGYSYGISIGKEVNPGFRIQLDVAHIKNDLDRVFVKLAGGVNVPVTDAKITQIPIILNAIWEPRGHGRLFPYIGLGVGAIKGKYSVADLPGVFPDLLDIGWAFALQVKVGLTYELSHSSSVTLGYQFLHAHYNSDLDLNNNLITLGVQFRF
jgi:opacity protein-like surface antigen